MPRPSTDPKIFWEGPNLLWHKNVWSGTNCNSIFGLTQKIYTGSKQFGTCSRTRHKYFTYFFNKVLLFPVTVQKVCSACVS